MADIKTHPAMDKPKTLNRDFVPKEAGSIWKAHHDQQEAQRGPKERGSVQYATDQVETTAGGVRLLLPMEDAEPSGRSESAMTGLSRSGRKKRRLSRKRTILQQKERTKAALMTAATPARGGTGQGRLPNSTVWSWAWKRLWRIVLKVLLSQESTAALKCRAPG